MGQKVEGVGDETAGTKCCVRQDASSERLKIIKMFYSEPSIYVSNTFQYCRQIGDLPRGLTVLSTFFSIDEFGHGFAFQNRGTIGTKGFKLIDVLFEYLHAPWVCVLNF